MKQVFYRQVLILDLPLDLLSEPLEYEIPVVYTGVTLPIKIPNTSYETEIGDVTQLR
jgi:hypothetical protein